MIKRLFNMIITKTSKTEDTKTEDTKTEDTKKKDSNKENSKTEDTKETCYYCRKNIKKKYTYGKYKYCSISCVNNDMDLYID